MWMKLLVTHTGKITILPEKLSDAGIHRREKNEGGLHIYGRANVLLAATLEALSHKPTNAFIHCSKQTVAVNISDPRQQQQQRLMFVQLNLQAYRNIFKLMGVGFQGLCCFCAGI